jgi:hypothetical protein
VRKQLVKASSTASYIMVRLCVTQGAFSRKSPHASEWRLTFNTCDVTGELAGKAFMRWGREKQNAVLKYPVAVIKSEHRAA